MALAQRGVACDVRRTVLRFCPAPDLSAVQLRSAEAALGEAARQL